MDKEETLALEWYLSLNDDQRTVVDEFLNNDLSPLIALLCQPGQNLDSIDSQAAFNKYN